MVEVKDVQRLPNGGHSYTWVYKMAGMRFEGTDQETEYVANQRIVSESKGGIQGTITWVSQAEDGRTGVTFQGEYTVPVPLLGKLAESILVKQNEREIDSLLANLKAKMEA